jgi:cold shock CspA family protein/ribosome-associated translation inhibitor RaiA
MIVPLQITVRNIQHSEAVDAQIREEVAKLEEFFDHLIHCRVVVEMPHHHQARGNPFHVQIRLEVPGTELIVSHQPNLHSNSVDMEETKHHKGLELEGAHKDLYLTIHDAFRKARRQLQEHIQRHRREVKQHTELPMGRVTRLFPKEGYGFLETFDGREVYFHCNSVLEDRFASLEVGSPVEFLEETGEKGPQASTVRAGR